MTFSTLDNRELKLPDQRNQYNPKESDQSPQWSRMIKERRPDTPYKAATRATIDSELDRGGSLRLMLDATAVRR
jgi:hypothetical protein